MTPNGFASVEHGGHSWEGEVIKVMEHLPLCPWLFEGHPPWQIGSGRKLY